MEYKSLVIEWIRSNTKGIYLFYISILLFITIINKSLTIILYFSYNSYIRVIQIINNNRNTREPILV